MLECLPIGRKRTTRLRARRRALIEHAEANGYTVPAEWVFQDEGYSGANLVRPGLEALRDLAAEGEIRAALVYSPDRAGSMPIRSCWLRSYRVAGWNWYS